MKYSLRLAFCIVLLVLTCRVNASGEIRLFGDGSIDYDGTGEFLLNRFFPLVFTKYDSDCAPSTIPGFIYICEQPLDMSLLANDIVRAEHVRIGINLHDLHIGFFMGFGCPNCGTFISVEEDDLVSAGAWKLSPQATQALQAVIDQHGASSLYMRIALQGGTVVVFSSVRAVTMDIKPGDVPNTLNPRSRGVIPVAILTTEQFDANSIDVPSLRFGATGEEAAAVRSQLDDVDNDGDTDLLVFFRSHDTGIDCETLFTYISGATLMGQDIAGTDSVNIVGCH